MSMDKTAILKSNNSKAVFSKPADINKIVVQHKSQEPRNNNHDIYKVFANAGGSSAQQPLQQQNSYRTISNKDASF